MAKLEYEDKLNKLKQKKQKSKEILGEWSELDLSDQIYQFVYDSIKTSLKDNINTGDSVKIIKLLASASNFGDAEKIFTEKNDFFKLIEKSSKENLSTKLCSIESFCKLGEFEKNIVVDHIILQSRERFFSDNGKRRIHDNEAIEMTSSLIKTKVDEINNKMQTAENQLKEREADSNLKVIKLRQLRAIASRDLNYQIDGAINDHKRFMLIEKSKVEQNKIISDCVISIIDDFFIKGPGRLDNSRGKELLEQIIEIVNIGVLKGNGMDEQIKSSMTKVAGDLQIEQNNIYAEYSLFYILNYFIQSAKNEDRASFFDFTLEKNLLEMQNANLINRIRVTEDNEKMNKILGYEVFMKSSFDKLLSKYSIGFSRTSSEGKFKAPPSARYVYASVAGNKKNEPRWFSLIDLNSNSIILSNSNCINNSSCELWFMGIEL